MFVLKKHAEVLYAKTALTRSSTLIRRIVSIRDLDLMYRLDDRNADRHWTEIRCPADKVDWENRLVDAADECVPAKHRKSWEQNCSA